MLIVGDIILCLGWPLSLFFDDDDADKIKFYHEQINSAVENVIKHEVIKELVDQKLHFCRLNTTHYNSLPVTKNQ